VPGLGPVSVAFVILSFNCAHDFLQGLQGCRDGMWDANFPEDSVEREAKCTSDEKCGRGERERLACHQRSHEKARVGRPQGVLEEVKGGGGWRINLDLGPAVRGKWKGR
jgi:hypothetical protein